MQHRNGLCFEGFDHLAPSESTKHFDCLFENSSFIKFDANKNFSQAVFIGTIPSNIFPGERAEICICLYFFILVQNQEKCKIEW